MVWMKWLPWRFGVRYLARAHGFIDPIALLARLHHFAQPSEVTEPIELLRAGVVMHSRGLINSRVIQHNLDWLWPYWVEKQYNPRSKSFIPRAFSITHINLTHRNWTAIGVPDFDELPIVDPRGLLTPFWDSWSIDSWLITDNKRQILPSRSNSATQSLELSPDVAVITTIVQDDLILELKSSVVPDQGCPHSQIEISAQADTSGWIAVALRPYNPEGISFVHKITLSPDRKAWTVDGNPCVSFSDSVERHHLSTYRGGDVRIHLHDTREKNDEFCNIGLLTAAALFRIEAGQSRKVTVRIRLDQDERIKNSPPVSWQESLANHCTIKIPCQHFQRLYEIALRTIVLHSPKEVYPGPFTYKRFWFRDAAFIIYSLLVSGLIDRAERAIDQFADRQTTRGYFLSQEGEWDSNGEALWTMRRFCEITGLPPKPNWLQTIRHGGEWIINKRLPDTLDYLHAGLLPAGFSAEHLGPNDFYYWDDFWGIAGLEAAATLMKMAGESSAAERFTKEARRFRDAVERSLNKVATRLEQEIVPASPYRRLDSGAIGSLVCGYPLQLGPTDDARLLNTVDFLLTNCLVDGGFFQDMIHSGINAYLTLHLAQVLLRAEDPRFFPLIRTVAELASPTGQWPEAIHPRTKGGCMGDGQHAWAAAEWILMIRNCFVREEGNTLILAAGIPIEWLTAGANLSFGPAPTSFGAISITLAVPVNNTEADQVVIRWQGKWHNDQPEISVRLPGFRSQAVATDHQTLTLIKD